jgi:hypothetical protein
MTAPQIITRDLVRKKLQDWKDGRLTSQGMLEWANSVYPSEDFDVEDWEGEDERSVTNEVLEDLCMLDMNLRLADDVPIYLDFLTTPMGDFRKGYEAFQKAMQAIDREDRKRQLSNDPLYVLYLGKNPFGSE